MAISDCKLVELPKFLDQRGNLSFAQNNAQIPFEIKRTYWLYDVPGGEDRGGHAYKTTDEFIIAIAGAFFLTPALNPLAILTKLSLFIVNILLVMNIVICKYL